MGQRFLMREIFGKIDFASTLLNGCVEKKEVACKKKKKKKEEIDYNFFCKALETNDPLLLLQYAATPQSHVGLWIRRPNANKGL